MPAARYRIWLAHPSRDPSARPPSSTTIGWNVKGTDVNGRGTLNCAAAAVSAATNTTDANEIARASDADSARPASA